MSFKDDRLPLQIMEKNGTDDLRNVLAQKSTRHGKK
jgi:hypothetical protein